MTAVMRCYYEVLNVAQDAEGVSIKKSYRKLALMYHPDKNAGREEEAAAEFQLVQEAYECLSDAKERQWYDEHRDMILRGVRLGEAGDGSNGADASYVFDVSPYFSISCYNGYGDGEGGFFAVYRHAFQQIVEGEYKGWISEGNIDETLMPNAHLMDTDFGNGSKDWLELSAFYHAWESFSTSLGFAWADKYDTRDAQSRWERRRMVEENKKARKVAKRDRNENILKLVSFVKKKDPRVETARKKAKQSQLEKEEKRKKDAIQKKLDRASAKEAWMEERQKELDKLEQNDMNFGRVRLADLDDSDDEFYGKGKKKGKKGKKKKNKKKLPG
jgi:DnaJ family protein A protein 5